MPKKREGTYNRRTASGPLGYTLTLMFQLESRFVKETGERDFSGGKSRNLRLIMREKYHGEEDLSVILLHTKGIFSLDFGFAKGGLGGEGKNDKEE